MDLPFDGIESDRVVRCVRGKDRDCVAGGEAIDGGLVGIWVFGVVWRVRVERCIEAIVDFCDVLE